MTKLTWDDTGKRFYENGVSQGVLFPMTTLGAYEKGVAWNGLISVTESPEGAEPNDLYADNTKYASIRSAETFKATVEAYTYPKEFEASDGYAELAEGVTLGQQDRQSFGLCYRTNVGNDTATSSDDAYKIHIVYGCTASPSEKGYESVNDSPDAITFSWEIDSTPVAIAGFKPSAQLIIDSRTVSPENMKKIEEKLYGGSGEPTIILPSEIASMISPAL